MNLSNKSLNLYIFNFKIMNLKKYTFTIFLIFISFLLLVLTFNRLIDPYGLYENPRVNNLNMDKPIFEKHIRMAKAFFAVKDKKPNAVILGSSKAEFGLILIVSF